MPPQKRTRCRADAESERSRAKRSRNSCWDVLLPPKSADFGVADLLEVLAIPVVRLGSANVLPPGVTFELLVELYIVVLRAFHSVY